MLTALRRVGEKVRGDRRRILVLLGKRAQLIDCVEALPLEGFLATLPA